MDVTTQDFLKHFYFLTVKGKGRRSVYWVTTLHTGVGHRTDQIKPGLKLKIKERLDVRDNNNNTSSLFTAQPFITFEKIEYFGDIAKPSVVNSVWS